ncbi:MAG: hypothetical protein IIC41_03005 [Candidatus Marinimicrobia bacterium]|nr:hypothetical protein [Candidatus Neomarinimicrobiota bacterium]
MKIVAVAVAVRGAKIAINPLILGLALGLSATGPLLAQLQLHGDVNPLVRITRAQRVMDLPHRFVTIEGRRQGSSVGMFFASALEYRPGRDSLTLELREAYAEVYTGLGDWRFGKQIITWGAADGNNPTDNISPYDFYYLFLPGTSRKMGTLAASANLYLGSLNLTAVMVPLFRPNRIPLNEPDFPIFGASGSPFGNLPVGEIPVERELGNSEVALRIGLPLSRVDLSLSYFSGHDRMFTPIPWINPISSMMIPDSITLQYLSTQVIGGDLVTFIGDFAVRTEAAYFMTEDDKGTSPFIRNPYLQYVLQLDYSGDQATYMAQYLGTYITKLDDEQIFNLAAGRFISEEENEQDHIPPKLGMPFAAIAQNAIMITVSRDFSDGRYSVRGQTLYDLDHGGYMLGGQVTVSLEEAFDIEVGLTMLGGGQESRLYAMRDFSHLSLALKYSF